LSSNKGNSVLQIFLPKIKKKSVEKLEKSVKKGEKMVKIGEKKNVLGDNIGFVELHNNAKGNLNEINRIDTISQVASVCFNREKSKKPENLFKRLKEESMGLPSSSFEFVPLLLTSIEVQFLRTLSDVVYNKTGKIYQPACLKFSEVITDEEDNSKWYVLTNLRALLNDSFYAEKYMNTNIENWYNNDVDADKIFKNCHLFKLKSSIFSLRQIMRHRIANYQELSRRYTKGNLEFYQSPEFTYDYSKVEEEYNKLLKQGVKAEDARQILPVSLYSTVWCMFTTSSFDNFIKLRTDKHTQEPTRLIANAMRDLVEESKGIEFPLKES
jgi:thymidylate synthase (FAD)